MTAMSKLAATLAFVAVGLVSPAFAIYGSYALSAAPAATLLFGKPAMARWRLFRRSRANLAHANPEKSAPALE